MRLLGFFQGSFLLSDCSRTRFFAFPKTVTKAAEVNVLFCPNYGFLSSPLFLLQYFAQSLRWAIIAGPFFQCTFPHAGQYCCSHKTRGYFLFSFLIALINFFVASKRGTKFSFLVKYVISLIKRKVCDFVKLFFSYGKHGANLMFKIIPEILYAKLFLFAFVISNFFSSKSYKRRHSFMSHLDKFLVQLCLCCLVRKKCFRWKSFHFYSLRRCSSLLQKFNCISCSIFLTYEIFETFRYNIIGAEKRALKYWLNLGYVNIFLKMAK